MEKSNYVCDLRKLSVVIPYRDREDHLTAFLSIFPMLCNWKNFHIFVVEQLGDGPFNRGKLFNVGFAESTDYDFHCFHDVDLIPVTSDYSYPETPTHLARYATQFKNADPSYFYYGGVNIINKQDFLKINGFSNGYLGWGCEDDDLRRRVLDSGFKFVKREGFYLSLPHVSNEKHDDLYTHNFEKLTSKYDFHKCGINSIKYDLISKETINTLYTHIKVKI